MQYLCLVNKNDFSLIMQSSDGLDSCPTVSRGIGCEEKKSHHKNQCEILSMRQSGLLV